MSVFRGPLLLLGLALICSGRPPLAAGTSQLVTYNSAVDESEHAYGIYVPETPPPSAQGYPAVFHGHGYGWGVSADFSDWQKQWADTKGWVLININARGPNFYGGIGDVAVMETVQDALPRLNLDPDRLYFTGVSMGGTGAYRQGVLHPDVFAAAAPVDGWTDYRLWHYHWYARKDLRSSIEEFRRPLLESLSPLFWYDRGRWGSLLCLISGSDTVVDPEEGLRLVEAVRSADADGTRYDVEMVYNPGAGHGGSNDMARIYNFFLGRRRMADPPDFTVASLNLSYGRLYWGEIERLHVWGLSARLHVISRPTGLEAVTRNVDAFALDLPNSEWARQKQVEVRVDGFPVYTGKPQVLHCSARRLPQGDLVGWDLMPPTPGLLRKRAGLEGPLGDAFMGPFLVVYGTAGTAEDTARHRREAENFCRAWNDFNVHATAVAPRPEQEVLPVEWQRRNLVIFGSLEASALLAQAQARHPLPVEVHRDVITVRDPWRGDRDYRGPHFGAFLVYPNPLADFSRYLAVLKGEWATRPDGTVPLGLGYDLEKLPWAYPDYVVFNTDQKQLPYVENVNNKPPVICYEAAYFAEAGFFDPQWRVDPFWELARYEQLQSPGVGLLSVRELRPAPGQVTALVSDAAGRPVGQARLTADLGAESRSVVSNAQGEALFPLPAGGSFRLLGLAATGAVYDWREDTLEGSLWADGDLALRPDPVRFALQGLETTPVALEVANLAARGRSVELGLLVPGGRVDPGPQELFLRAGETRRVSFWWNPHDLPPGPYRLVGQVSCEGRTLTREMRAELGRPASPVRLALLQADRPYGASWVDLTARLVNGGPADVRVRVQGYLVGLGLPLPTRLATLQPSRPLTLTWRVELPAGLYPPGQYQVRLFIPEHEGSTITCPISVPPASS